MRRYRIVIDFDSVNDLAASVHATLAHERLDKLGIRHRLKLKGKRGGSVVLMTHWMEGPKKNA